MCLGVPGRVVTLDAERGVARLELFGIEREVRLDLLDEPLAAGDTVMSQGGFALRRIPDEEVGPTLELYEALFAQIARDGAGG
jgi:hydrogenase expression/formation protein HypC